MAPPPPLPAPTTQFITAITRVAVSQICRSVGYDAAEGGALAALTTLYLRSLATSAASSATSSGRTQPNLLDLASAVDSLASHRGFPGASDHRRPILSSSAVRDVIAFAAAVEETPSPDRSKNNRRSAFRGLVMSRRGGTRRRRGCRRGFRCFRNRKVKLGFLKRLKM
ncbi:hypothetical protein QJS10_CPA16g00616 [Acorus calamus]|uniref:Bromodomain associated domain-containing protein n=1 Tax=Acorus calamus TaxID=4465 RepID=A0AAV9D0W3_ACOCL|nr:hypothetical protein QJS10_CPA16g00616 [Acorus calamus]